MSCVVPRKQFNKFATCMAEASFACRSAQVPVKLKMRCCTAAHCMPRTIYAWLTPAEACLCRLPMDAQQGHWWRQPNPSASIPILC